MTQTSPIVQQTDIEGTILYELNELIGENMDIILIAGVCFIGAFIGSYIARK